MKRNENRKEYNGQVGGVTEGKNNEKDILREGTIMALGRNMVLGNLPEIHNDDSS